MSWASMQHTIGTLRHSTQTATRGRRLWCITMRQGKSATIGQPSEQASARGHELSTAEFVGCRVGV